MFWLLWIIAFFVLIGADLPWWAWVIWVFAPVVKIGGKSPRPETNKQRDYIRDLCRERGMSRREAITEALGGYQRDLSIDEASEVIDWLLAN